MRQVNRPPVYIALATDVDVDRIVEIEQEAFSPPWTRGDFLSELEREDSFFIVAIEKAEEPSPCLGFAVVRQVGDDGELLKIAAFKGVRRCGVGDLLMNAVLGHASEKAFKSVFLEVRSSNAPAIALYEKHDFMPLRTRKDYYDNPTEDAVVMVNLLSR